FLRRIRLHMPLQCNRGLDTPCDLLRLHLGGPEHLDQVVARLPRVDSASAREHVYGCVPQLWPGVNGQVRLGDDHHAAHALGTKLVERHLAHLGASQERGVHHDLFDDLPVVQHLRVTSVCLAQDVTTQSMLHLSASLGKYLPPKVACPDPPRASMKRLLAYAGQAIKLHCRSTAPKKSIGRHP